MESIEEYISAVFIRAFKECGYDSKFGQVVDSQRPDLGQFQCNGALPAAKTVGKNPREIATQIIAKVENNRVFKDLNIAGPGFINIVVDDLFLAEHINAVFTDSRLGCTKVKDIKNVIIDFGSPNVAKPMHVGHLRSAIIGDCLQRLFRFSGYNVVSDNHVGDWGTQMGMLICELRRINPGLSYFDDSFTGLYPEESPISLAELESMYPSASLRCSKDEKAMADAVSVTDELQKGRRGYVALWKHFVALSISSLKKDFEKLNIRFDKWLGESFYTQRMNEVVKKLRSEGVAVLSEGALVIEVSEDEDNKEIPPVMLVKSGGGFLYATSDIATIDYRMKELNADIILYVVDKRQSLHFKQVFRAVRKASLVKSDTVLEHIGFGTVNGKDGKPFKTREGGVMKLSDMIDQVTEKAEERMKEAGIAQDCEADEYRDIAHKVGIATLKFADLMNHRMSNYIFDIDKFCRFEGKTGPYLLYTSVRIKSILRRAEKENLTEGTIIPPNKDERNLMLILSRLPDVLRNAEEKYAPNYLCDFAYSLAQEFNRFYKECHILSEKDKKKQASWLSLIKLCLREFELLLKLLGIEIPERM